MSLQKMLRQKKLQEVLLSFRNLPSPPRLHNKLKEILQREQLSQKEIAAEIENSPVLTANLLRMANSIFFGVRKSISNVFDALSFIGTESVLNIVLSLESFDCLCSSASPDSLKIAEEIRLKSIIRAQIAREIALSHNGTTDPQQAYIAGLMLDIGLILRCCSSLEKFDKFYSEWKEKNKPVFLADKEAFTTTHDEVGEALLSYWNFSESIISAVANHHCYTNRDDLTFILQIADMVVQGEDSLPHDPCIEAYAKVWGKKLNANLELIRNSEIK